MFIYLNGQLPGSGTVERITRYGLVGADVNFLEAV